MWVEFPIYGRIKENIQLTFVRSSPGLAAVVFFSAVHCNLYFWNANTGTIILTYCQYVQAALGSTAYRFNSVAKQFLKKWGKNVTFTWHTKFVCFLYKQNSASGFFLFSSLFLFVGIITHKIRIILQWLQA